MGERHLAQRERAAQRADRARREARQVIEEKDSAVGENHLPGPEGPRRAPHAHESLGARAPVGHAQWAAWRFGRRPGPSSPARLSKAWVSTIWLWDSGGRMPGSRRVMNHVGEPGPPTRREVVAARCRHLQDAAGERPPLGKVLKSKTVPVSGASLGRRQGQSSLLAKGGPRRR